MSDPNVIYLGPACQEQGQLDGREWCQDDVWDACECGHESVRYVLGADFDRVTAERDAALADAELWRGRCGAKCYEVDALQQRLTAADERVGVLEGLLRKWLSQFPKPGITGGPITTLKEETAKAMGAKESGSHA
ncbi:hypothetical protein AO066_18385 [Pseudomonas fluorescens]|nr:hypothetical protein AO066_18385 [Pseudomonas fluorescens]